MAVVSITNCKNGHPMRPMPQRAVFPCKGCGQPASTLYDCESRCYGKCDDCWRLEVRDAPPVGEAYRGADV